MRFIKLLPARTLIYGLALLGVGLLTACASKRTITTPSFSFSEYDTVVFARADNQQTIPLYGIDLELANALTKKGFVVMGEKQLSTVSEEIKKKTLIAQVHFSTTTRRSIASVSFFNAATGKAELSVTDVIKGNLSDSADLSSVTEAIVSAIEDVMSAEAAAKSKKAAADKAAADKAAAEQAAADKAAADKAAADKAAVAPVTEATSLASEAAPTAAPATEAAPAPTTDTPAPTAQ